jgi:hypothetical protein
VVHNLAFSTGVRRPDSGFSVRDLALDSQALNTLNLEANNVSPKPNRSQLLKQHYTLNLALNISY